MSWCLYSRLVSAEELLDPNITLIFIATKLLKLFCSKLFQYLSCIRYFMSGNIYFLLHSILLLHPLKLKATRMPPFQHKYVFTLDLICDFIFRFTLIWKCIYFLLVSKIMLFSHEKVVVMQFDADHWFYTPLYGKWLLLKECSGQYSVLI